VRLVGDLKKQRHVSTLSPGRGWARQSLIFARSVFRITVMEDAPPLIMHERDLDLFAFLHDYLGSFFGFRLIMHEIPVILFGAVLIYTDFSAFFLHLERPVKATVPFSLLGTRSILIAFFNSRSMTHAFKCSYTLR